MQWPSWAVLVHTDFCVMKFLEKKMDVWTEDDIRDVKTCQKVVFALTVKFLICFNITQTVGMSEYMIWSIMMAGHAVYSYGKLVLLHAVREHVGDEL